jgi:hypothetical protein
MESLFIGAQLRDVFAAENSPIMPQEDDHGWLPQPQRTQAQFVAIGIGKLNHREPAVERGFHTRHFQGTRAKVKAPRAGGCADLDG